MSSFRLTTLFPLCFYFFCCCTDLTFSENFGADPLHSRTNFQFQDTVADINQLLLSDTSGEREYTNKDYLSLFLEQALPFYLKEWIKSGKLEVLAQNGLFTNVSQECALASTQWIKEITGGILTGELKYPQTWAFHMIDAWGKFPDGVLSGHVSSPGDFHECLQIRGNYTNRESQEAYFRGSYCSSYVLPLLPKATNETFRIDSLTQNSRESVSPYELLTTMLDLTSMVPILPFMGTCFPSVCSQNDSQTILSNAHALAGNFTTQYVLQCYTDEKPPLDNADITVIVLLTIITTLCICGTFVDVLIYRKIKRGSVSKNKETVLKVFVAFSLYTNIQKWANVSVGADNLGCLHGLRFLSMCWVVLSHTVTMYPITPYVWNMIDVKKVYKGNWTIYALLNGTPSVDTFFTMSGVLCAYSLLKMLDKQRGKLNIPLVYFHRYVRITPTYMIIVGMMATLLPYISSGPAWYMIDSESKNCEKNWWHNILYINNLVKYTAPDGPCYGESWYLANDMQFFWLSPLIIYPIWRWKRVGLGFLGLLSIISIVTPAVISHSKELPPTVTPFYNIGTYMEDIYNAPWSRIGPYLVGIFLGFILHSMSVYPKSRKRLSKYLVIGGWILSTVVALAIIFGPMSYFDPVNEEAAKTSVGAALYAGLHRYVWGIVISWIIFACVNGYGGWVNDFLSWSPFIPLGRLTFCVYITSYHVQKIYHITVTTPIYFTPYLMTNFFFAHLVLSMLVGFVFTITLESPFIQLEKIIFARENSKPMPPVSVNNNDPEISSTAYDDKHHNQNNGAKIKD